MPKAPRVCRHPDARHGIEHDGRHEQVGVHRSRSLRAVRSRRIHGLTPGPKGTPTAPTPFPGMPQDGVAPSPMSSLVHSFHSAKRSHETKIQTPSYRIPGYAGHCGGHVHVSGFATGAICLGEAGRTDYAAIGPGAPGEAAGPQIIVCKNLQKGRLRARHEAEDSRATRATSTAATTRPTMVRPMPSLRTSCSSRQTPGGCSTSASSPAQTRPSGARATADAPKGGHLGVRRLPAHHARHHVRSTWHGALQAAREDVCCLDVTIRR